MEVRLLERGSLSGGEQGVNQLLQTQELRDGLDFNGDPGTVLLLTGDGEGSSMEPESLLISGPALRNGSRYSTYAHSHSRLSLSSAEVSRT